MSSTDLLALSPLWIAAAAALVLLLLIAVKRQFGLAAGFSLAAAASGLVAVFLCARLAPRTVASLVVVDGYALFFTGLFFAAGFIIFLLASSYFRPRRSAGRNSSWRDSSPFSERRSSPGASISCPSSSASRS